MTTRTMMTHCVNCLSSMTKKSLMTLALIMGVSATSMAQTDDFGYELGIEGETKLAKGLKLEMEAGMRTQDDGNKIDRYVVGAGLSYRLYQSDNKKFSVKTGLGFDYLWTQQLAEKDLKYFDENDNLVEAGYFNVGDLKGYNITDNYWRDRMRFNASVSASYSPNKRWSFSLKETVQHSHYFAASTSRVKYRVDEYNSEVLPDGTINWIYSPFIYDEDEYMGDDNLDANGNIIGKYLNEDTEHKKRKDKTILRSKLTVGYDIKGFPIDLFASIDYGCGLNYTTNKWKFTGGYDYKINKQNKLSLYYRYNTEDDDDEANGHLVGLSYKFSF